MTNRQIPVYRVSESATCFLGVQLQNQSAHDLPDVSKPPPTPNLVQISLKMWTPIAETQTDIRLGAGRLDWSDFLYSYFFMVYLFTQ